MRSIFFVLAFGGVAWGDDSSPKEKGFEAPPPRQIQLDWTILPPSLPQPGTREIWQYYGVDNRGRWRPRVIMSPYGAYYSHNGEPFGYTTTQPGLYMPYVVD